MQRIPEMELMDQEAHAQAYAGADFSEPHDRFIALFQQRFPRPLKGTVLDLGCGAADIGLRFARAFPDCRLHGVDGAAAMLAHGETAIKKAAMEQRLRLIQAYLPGAELPQAHYDAVISNSLLHHLADPAALWQSIQRYAGRGAPVFVMDLYRPASKQDARHLVEAYTAGEPEVLRDDFYNSLLAAYTEEEIQEQLKQAGLSLKVEVVSDRHLIVHGNRL